MMKKRIIMELLIVTLFIGCAGQQAVNSGTGITAGKINTLNFDNKSGYNAIVRVFYDGTKERVAEVAVPKGKIRGTNIANGKYYIVTKYGPMHGKKETVEYIYSQGESFDLVSPEGQYIKATITLHKVVDGNYSTQPVDASAFGE